MLQHSVSIFFLSLFSTAMAVAQTTRTFSWTNSSDGKSKVEAYLPQHPTGRAIVDLPGGGYSHLALDHEGHQWADYFNQQGIAYFVVTYRMPNGDRNVPLGDVYRAMQTVRDSARSWQINPADVGIMGFSAGGHLASAVSTHAPFAVRPNFSILFYPVVSMNEHETHRGSVMGFLGEGRHDETLVKNWSNFNAVRRHLTPPAIIILANDDRVVPPVTNGIAYYSAMRRQGNDCSLIVYPNGGHGFGFNPQFAYHDQMLAELTTWLHHIKAPLPTAKRVACIGNSITDGSGIDLNDTYGYPARLQRMLGENYIVKNFGVSGRCLLNKSDHPYMKELAWRDALAFCPDVVIVKLGTNDSKPFNWANGADFGHDLQQMIDSLKALSSHPRIVLCSPIPAHINQTSARWGINDSVIVNGIVPVIKKVAKKNKLQYLDLHTLFAQAGDGLMQADGVHPNDKGAEKMAEIMKQEVFKEK
jgi:acetyl esterase/lipase/lysophospholipase L1-like esterase